MEGGLGIFYVSLVCVYFLEIPSISSFCASFCVVIYSLVRYFFLTPSVSMRVKYVCTVMWGGSYESFT